MFFSREYQLHVGSRYICTEKKTPNEVLTITTLLISSTFSYGYRQTYVWCRYISIPRMVFKRYSALRRVRSWFEKFMHLINNKHLHKYDVSIRITEWNTQTVPVQLPEITSAYSLTTYNFTFNELGRK